MTTKRLVFIFLPWITIAVVGVLSAWLRYGFIEPPALAHLCDDRNGPASCGLRQFIVTGFNSYGFGFAALAITLLALIWKKPALAWLAAALGMFALIMYCYYAGAVALLIGCLRLLRLQANRMATPVDEHRQSNRKVQAQP
jgi:hypothetical protein